MRFSLYLSSLTNLTQLKVMQVLSQFQGLLLILVYFAAMKDACQHPDSYAGYTLAKRLFSRMDENRNSNKTYQKVYQILIAGDPKHRTYRVVLGDVMTENR